MKRKYKIAVHLPTQRTLTYSIEEYEMEGNLIKFTDRKTGKIKHFDSRICEIEEVGSND